MKIRKNHIFGNRLLAFVCTLFALAFTFSASSAVAATLTWDPSQNHTGSDGLGTWDTTSSFWATGSADTTWTSGATAAFGSGGTAGTVTIATGGVTDTGGLLFNSGITGNYTIGGSATLTLWGGITANNSATISAPLALGPGNQLWAPAGGDTLTISGAVTRSAGATLMISTNAATGLGVVAYNPTLVNGIVGAWAIITNSGAGANSSASGYSYATTSGGNIVAYTAGTALTGGWTWSAPGANTANYDVTGVNQIGTTRTANTIRYTGPAATELIANNDAISFTNNGVINDGTGTYTIGSGDTVGGGANPTTSHGKLVIGANRELVAVAASANITFGLPIGDYNGGASAMTIVGPNTVTFNKCTNTYSGGTYVTSGTLALSGAGTTLGTSANALTISGGTLDLGTLSITVGAVTNISGTIQNGTLTNASFVANNPGTAAVSATLAGASATLTKNGVGTFTLSAANVYGGLTTVNAGTLVMSATHAGNGAFTVNGGTLSVSTVQTNAGAITVNDGGTLSVTVSGTSQVQPSALTLGSVNGGTNSFAGVNSLTVPPVKTGTLTVNGTSKINIQTITLAVGTYPLIQANATSGSGTLTVGTVPTGVTAHLTTTGSGPYVINLVIDNIAADVWAAGNGNWDTTTQNWKLLASPAYYADGQPVVFDDTATGSGPFTVAITPSTVSPGAVIANITNKNYTITGTTSGTAIAGSGNLTKNGTGTLTLLGTNTYSAGTIINAGTVQLGDGSSQNGVVAGNILNNGSLAVANANNQTLGNAISGTGSLTKTGNGVLTLTAANTYSGYTAVNAGTVQVTGPGTFGNGTGLVTNNATILLNGGTIADPILNNGTITNVGATVVSGPISGSGSIQTTNTGNLTLSGNNSAYTGTVYVQPTASNIGLVLANNNALGSSGSVVVTTTTSGTPGGSMLALTGGVSIPVGVSASLSCDFTTSTRSVLASLGSSGQTNTWNGPLVLSGDNIIILDGTAGTFWNVAGNISGPSFITATPATGGLQLRQVNGQISGQINLPQGNLQITDGTTWTIRPPAPDINSWLYTAISSGTLKLGTNDALPATTVINNASGSGTLDLNGFTQVLAGFTNSTTAVSTGANPVTNSSLTTASALIFSNSLVPSTYTGAIKDGYPASGMVGLTVAAGTLTLSSTTDTYSGNTTINTGGTLQLGSATAIPNGANKGNVNVNTGGTFDLNNNSPIINGLTGSGVVDNVSAGGAATLTLGSNGVSSTFNGVVQNTSGSVSVTKVGTGIITLAGANTYSGVTTVSQGQLVISSAQVGTSDNATVADGATLAVTLSGSSQWTPNSLAVGNTTVGGALGFYAVANGGPAPIGSVASVTFFGAATRINVESINGSPTVGGIYPLMAVTPSSASVLGATVVLGDVPPGTTGHLTITGGDNSGGALNFVVDSASEIWTGTAGNGNWDLATGNWNAGLFVNGDNVLFDDTATGTTNVVVNAAITPGNISVNNSVLTYSIAATTGKAIGGTHSLNKTGTGTLTLSGPNTYSGGTTLTAGQLNLGGGATGPANSPIGTGTLTINTGTIDNTSGADLTLQPAIAENWNGNFTYEGSAHSLNLGSGAINLGASIQLTVATNTLTIPGVITDANNGYGLTKVGNGTLTLANSNSYSGPTTLLTGQLNLNTNSALSTNTFTIAGGVLDNTGAGDVVLGGNPQNWNANITYLGTLHNLNLGTGAVTLAVSPVVAVSNNTLTVGGSINGAFGLTKTGSGTLNLTGNSAFTGNVYDRAGTMVVDTGGAIYSPGGAYTDVGQFTNDVAVMTLKGTSTFTNTSDFNVGDLDASIGTLNIQDSASLMVGQFFVGSANAAGSTAMGTVNQTGGSLTETNAGIGFFCIGGRTSTNGVGIYNISGGTLSAAAGIRVGSTGTGIMTVSGTAVVNANGGFNTARLSGSTGTLNLNGGTVITMNLASSTSVNSTNHFNGSTVSPTINNTTWVSGLACADIRNGGAIFDTAGLSVTNPQAFLHSVVPGDNAIDGGVTKNGAGWLCLSGADTYTGNTTVNAGTLEIVQPTLYTNSTVTVVSGATLQLDFTVTNIVQQLVLNGTVQAPGVYNSITSAGYLAGAGSLKVPTTGPSLPAHLTNSVSGGVMTFTWPAGQGWRLVSETNSLSVGITTNSLNWNTVPGGIDGSNSIAIDPTKPTVFYRLVYP